MQLAGFNPDTFYRNPSYWLAITGAKCTSNDHYPSGSPDAIRSLCTVLSPKIDVGKALLADASHSEMLCKVLNIAIACSGGELERNLITVRGEMRLLPIFCTVGSMRLIMPLAA